MLQWMGGSRKRIRERSKNSKQRQVRAFFEHQRLHQPSRPGVDGRNSFLRPPASSAQSLDILALQAVPESALDTDAGLHFPKALGSKDDFKLRCSPLPKEYLCPKQGLTISPLLNSALNLRPTKFASSEDLWPGRPSYIPQRDKLYDVPESPPKKRRSLNQDSNIQKILGPPGTDSQLDNFFDELLGAGSCDTRAAEKDNLVSHAQRKEFHKPGYVNIYDIIGSSGKQFIGFDQVHVGCTSPEGPQGNSALSGTDTATFHLPSGRLRHAEGPELGSQSESTATINAQSGLGQATESW